jgi:hypothetical protein
MVSPDDTAVTAELIDVYVSPGPTVSVAAEAELTNTAMNIPKIKSVATDFCKLLQRVFVFCCLLYTTKITSSQLDNLKLFF